MPTPARFPSGVVNRTKAHPLGGYNLLDPSTWVTYYNDFLTFAAADFTITEATGNSTQALGAGLGGWLALTHPATTDDSLLQLQLVTAPFTIRSNKKAVFGARFKASDVTQSDILLGMTVTDTTLVDASSAISFTDGVF
ncbi:MAG: hypothetical protein MN733_35855, partial [Nitrososphaera sp.]|nr:hypothetical protein [Nitrososphaera sp.]